MLTKSVFAVAALSFLFASLPPADGPRLPGQGLNHCDIDPRDDDRNEVQVYCKPHEGSPNAVTFEIWDRYSDFLLMGNADVTKEVLVKTPHKDAMGNLKKNTVVFSYDTDTGKVKVVLTNAAGESATIEDLEPVGTYDSAGYYDSPTMTRVRHPDRDKRRFLITAQNYGLTYSFVLSDV